MSLDVSNVINVICYAMDNLTAHRQLRGPLVITEGSRIFDDGILRVILSLIKGTSMNTTLGNVINFITNNTANNLPGLPPSWTKFVNKWLSRHNVSIDDNVAIILKDFEYFVELSKILSKYENKPRVLANYLGLKLVLQEMLFMPTSSLVVMRLKLTMSMMTSYKYPS